MLYGQWLYDGVRHRHYPLLGTTSNARMTAQASCQHCYVHSPAKRVHAARYTTHAAHKAQHTPNMPKSGISQYHRPSSPHPTIKQLAYTSNSCRCWTAHLLSRLQTLLGLLGYGLLGLQESSLQGLQREAHPLECLLHALHLPLHLLRVLQQPLLSLLCSPPQTGPLMLLLLSWLQLWHCR